jgi:hypothetical protein
MTPDAHDYQAVILRLRQLERRMRLLYSTLASILGLGCLLALVAAAPTKEKVLEANRFVLRGEDGKRAALLAVGADGPTFELLDGREKTRLALHITKGEPTLQFYDEEEKPRAILILQPDGPTLAFSDRTNLEKLKLQLEKQTPRILLFDEAAARIKLETGPDGPTVGIYGEHHPRIGFAVRKDRALALVADDLGRTRVAITAGKDEGRIRLLDGKENSQLSLEARKGLAGVGLYDANRRLRAVLEISDEGPRLRLLDGEAKTLFDKP